MVPCLLFTILQVGEVALNAFGPTERERWMGMFTVGLDGRLNHEYQDFCEEEVLNKSQEDMPCSPESLKTSCLIYPNNQIDCSWMLNDVSNDSRYHASILVPDDSYPVGMGCQRRADMVDAGVGYVSATCQVDVNSVVILTVNVSRDDMWCQYTCEHQAEDIELLSPPSKVTASVTGTDLLVRWDHPANIRVEETKCLNYQLVINDRVKNLTEAQNMTDSESVDPTQSYKVKMRVKYSMHCTGYKNWSNWSNTINVEPPNQLNPLAVACIALGIPMILLALMLLIRLQRDRLFPPIPGPPLKIKHLLEKDQQSQFVPQVHLSKCVEEITIVEEAEEIPDRLTKGQIKKPN